MMVGMEQNWPAQRRSPAPSSTASRLTGLSAVAIALLPLRAFLGVTFCFAGLQKLANPSFFKASSPTSIQSQLHAAARHSPIHALLTSLSSQASMIGLLIALGELAVGVGALAGLLTRVAAIGGALLSLSLFLAVSFHTSPYYTGSDIVFVFAWLPLAIAGGGAFSLDAYVEQVITRRRAGRTADMVDVERRRLVGALAGALGFTALLGAGVVAGVGRMLHASKTSGGTAGDLSGLGATPVASTNAPAPSNPPGSSSASTQAVPSPTTPATTPTKTPQTAATPTPRGTKVGPASAVPVKGAATFQDPATGDPAVVVQPRAGAFVAFDAVCPHAGCTVGYEPGHALFVCPCHGSQFNGSTGAVEVGPASRGLRKIAIAAGPDGQLYVT